MLSRALWANLCYMGKYTTHRFIYVALNHHAICTNILYFSQYVSSLISVQRSLPDLRDPWCKTEEAVLPLDQLPETSIIICFHNEAWSTLLRTVHSVLDRSPMSLVQQIILGKDVCYYLFLIIFFSWWCLYLWISSFWPWPVHEPIWQSWDTETTLKTRTD